MSIESQIGNVTAELPGRVKSLDAFRGGLVLLFAVSVALPEVLKEWGVPAYVNHALKYIEPTIWEGISVSDLLMPGFLFVTGMAMSLAVVRRQKLGQTDSRILLWIGKRCLFLCCIGLLLDGGVLHGFSEIRWLGPFQRIAFCGSLAAIGALCFGPFLLVGISVILLMNYGFSFEAFTVPISVERRAFYAPDGISPYSPEFNIAAYIDQLFLPGRKLFGTWDSQGLLTTVPALAISLVGACCGSRFLRDIKNKEQGQKFPWIPCLAAFVLVNFSILLLDWQPWIPSLMTPSFVMVALGILLPIFFLLSGIEGFRGVSQSFEVIGLLGRHSLLAMMILHCVHRYGSVIADFVLGKCGIPVARPQTFIWGIFLIVVLVTLRMMARRNSLTWHGSASGPAVPAS